MDTANHEHGSQVLVFLDETRTLWSVDSANPTACPSSVPFSLTIPSEFQRGNDERYELPPSFTASFPELAMSIGYSLTVRVVENHYPLIGFLRGSPRYASHVKCNARVSSFSLIKPACRIQLPASNAPSPTDTLQPRISLVHQDVPRRVETESYDHQPQTQHSRGAYPL